jgi:F-type H+/Na+-transporting ATPase subunit beta
MAHGKIKQIIGPTLDIEFPSDHFPNLLNAIKIVDAEKNIDLTAEVMLDIGDNTFRCIALSSTDGLVRGMAAIDTGGPISVPVGPKTLGRLFNILGEPIDCLDPIDPSVKRASIHTDPPAFSELAAQTEIFETGIKVIDLIGPIPKGGKVGLFGGAGVGKSVIVMELIRNISAEWANAHVKAMICGLK